MRTLLNHLRKLPRHLTWIVAFLVIVTAVAFRWMAWVDQRKAIEAIQGVLRSEYLTANSYALSKAVGDLESLGVFKCVVITEKFETDRVFYDTSGRSACQAPRFFQERLENRVDLSAVNGLVYGLQFRIPFRWSIVLLEALVYLVIIALARLYWKEAQEQRLKTALAEALHRQSRQVSHDIRSSLATLIALTTHAQGLDEESKVQLRGAANRIRDIANNLLKQSKPPQAAPSAEIPSSNKIEEVAFSSEPFSTEALAPLIDGIFSQKKIQFSEQKDLALHFEMAPGSVAASARVQPTELSRILSNLINNSIEARTTSCRIEGSLSGLDDHVLIRIKDNGKGIPEPILKRLGQECLSYGKEGTESGSGLGVLHARATIERWAGQFSIKSAEDAGTLIEIALPAETPPRWFLDSLRVSPATTVLILDDDPGIHDLWTKRFSAALSACHEPTCTPHHFHSGEELLKWYRDVTPDISQAVLVFDHDLGPNRRTGLELIEMLGVGAQAALITLQADDPALRQRCLKQGVQLLPKSLLRHVPIQISGERKKRNN